ncbi:hypothetical protein [Kribbella sp. NPDC055071]
MTRFAVTLAVFGALSIGVGFLVADGEFCDWGVAGGLFAVAVVGESLRLWLNRSRAKKQQSSKI